MHTKRFLTVLTLLAVASLAVQCKPKGITPASTSVPTNTATVTPADITPGDNTSTWVIGNIQAAAEVVIAPAFTG